jgi:hypothetical protein
MAAFEVTPEGTNPTVARVEAAQNDSRGPLERGRARRARISRLRSRAPGAENRRCGRPDGARTLRVQT